MFNPQRKSKVNDILMEEKAFQLHLDKVKHIRQSYSLSSSRNHHEHQQLTYLHQLDSRRKQVRGRLTHGIRRQNHRLLAKLNATDNRPEQNPEAVLPQKHFNSYFNNQREHSRIRVDNFQMLNRMVRQGSMVPSLQEMKKDFKQNKRYAKMVRKLPSILRHQEEFKRQMSSSRMSDSKLSMRSKSSRGHSLNAKPVTKEIREIQTTLVSK